ncbi:MAG: phosphatase PAP2 family protein [Bdellovibrionota bacterium]
MQIKLIGLLVVFFALGDLISNQLKYIFQRMRPAHAEYFFDLGGKGSFEPSLSFPSNHAFNLFALSTLLILLRRKGYLKGVNFPIALWGLGLVVGISRVLLWRHYPLDIVAGLFFGTLFAMAFLPLITKVVHAPKLTDKL